ncbi:dihydroorotase [Thermosynechococcus sp. NK55a]|uniref:dihydroorotase n=1 Tax=unclassified Thermosynechococcus TaxID=2622553 RepID=UPI0003D7ED50|nr:MULTISPECIES: dihydroorotase [unclassified Thermosynechococcus]AHB87649.1 dihydroorotase [Thermosynechococcus sp. NK55a]RMH68020.1 MAG: dihydroorotase [Cyanobacteria bacterium J003]HIK22659.1 dihydroorotase [Thermosynechococcus sp. M3746_W2019_013]
MAIAIQNAVICTPEGELRQQQVRLEGDRIAEVAERVTVHPGDTVIDATGLTLLPGVIDPQVHFREPGLEHKEDLFTASCACAKGGVTSFLEMPNTRPLTIDQASLEDKLARAAAKCVVNYGFFIGATQDNLAVLNTVHPVCGIKIFMGSMHGPLLVDEEPILDRIFSEGKRLIAVHAEDQGRIRARRAQLAGITDVAIHSQIQDEIAALNATQLAVKLSRKYERRLHILHLSTGIEVDFLREHKLPWITVEVTPQHLLLTTEAYAKIGSLAQMNPPLRTAVDNEKLWQGLLDGVIDFIATDHAPHTLEEKAQPYPHSPSGMPGVETSLPLMLTQAMAGRCTVPQVVRWMSTAVAAAYEIPNKGKIAPGYDADLVLVDLQTYRPVRREELLTKCRWSPFEGWSLTGWPVYTFVNGEVVFSQGQVNTAVRGRPLRFGLG